MDIALYGFLPQSRHPVRQLFTCQNIAMTFIEPSFTNPFMPSGLFYHNTLDQYISKKIGVWVFLLLPCFIKKNPVLNGNSADPDQTPRSAASDLGLHCLRISLLWDARRKLVKSSFLA